MRDTYLDYTKREFTHGVDRVVYYPSFGETEIWNGVINIEEDENGTIQRVGYIDGQMVRTTYAYTDFSFSVEAYTYPELIEISLFDLCYRTYLNLEETAYELHIVYGCKAVLDSSAWLSLSGDTDPTTFTLNVTTLPPKNPVSRIAPGSHLILRSSDIPFELLEKLEDILYGTDTTDPRMPSIEELEDLLEDGAKLRITDHGDGTWSAEGSDNIVDMVSQTEFFIDYQTAQYTIGSEYTVQSG